MRCSNNANLEVLENIIKEKEKLGMQSFICFSFSARTCCLFIGTVLFICNSCSSRQHQSSMTHEAIQTYAKGLHNQLEHVTKLILLIDHHRQIVCESPTLISRVRSDLVDPTVSRKSMDKIYETLALLEEDLSEKARLLDNIIQCPGGGNPDSDDRQDEGKKNK